MRLEGTLRSLHKNKPEFRTCCLAPEYWDFMRFVLAYAPKGLRLVPGRDSTDFPSDAFLSGISRSDNDLVYLSYTSNPVGRTMPEHVFLQSLDLVPDDTLFFVDCTSIDIEQRSSVEFIRTVLKNYSHKNLLITKSFSKEYELGDLRIGYALFTRKESAAAIWPYMSGYPSVHVSKTALSALKTGFAEVTDRYRHANRLLKEMSEAHPKFRITGDCSNYTLVFCSRPEQCVQIKQRLQEAYGHLIYPGELPMQGGGDVGLKGELDLPSMKDIPFLSPDALRLVVTPESVKAFENVLSGLET